MGEEKKIWVSAQNSQKLQSDLRQSELTPDMLSKAARIVWVQFRKQILCNLDWKSLSFCYLFTSMQSHCGQLPILLLSPQCVCILFQYKLLKMKLITNLFTQNTIDQFNKKLYICTGKVNWIQLETPVTFWKDAGEEIMEAGEEEWHKLPELLA